MRVIKGYFTSLHGVFPLVDKVDEYSAASGLDWKLTLSVTCSVNILKSTLSTSGTNWDKNNPCVFFQLMRRKYWSYRKPLSYSWAKTDRDITRRMNMFKSYLDSLPKNRLDYVTDLDIPDITLSPYEWTDLDDYCYTLRRDGYLSDSWRDYYLKSSLSTDSSIPLSRALTDSDIDYDFYKRVISVFLTYEKSGYRFLDFRHHTEI